MLQNKKTDLILPANVMIYLHVSKNREHILATGMHGTFIAPDVGNFVANDDKETFEDESETKKGA